MGSSVEGDGTAGEGEVWPDGRVDVTVRGPLAIGAVEIETRRVVVLEESGCIPPAAPLT